ncbi:MAG: ABC transporter family substrate-binding protein [Bifidobacteriaceae bacterium]|jgi:peptide/nickel transport system substrate-binding protein|nr:ABC transporter family substrate-binding protein [Bifidobacteriaceae bacterium]
MTTRHGRLAAIGAAAAALALVVSGCNAPSTDDAGTGDKSGAPTTTGGGTVTVGWNQPLFSMNYMSGNGHATANYVITYMTRANWAYYDPDLNFVKNEELGQMRVDSEDPLTITQTINPEAKWSDGTPLSAVDLLLEWAARSSVFNDTSDADIETNEEGAVTGVTEGKVYFDAGDPAVAIIQDTPTISEDDKEITFVYSKPFPDWQYNFPDYPLPAHVVGKRALGIDDPAEAQAAVAKAIQDKNTEDLAKIAKVWSFDFDLTAMPEGDDVELVLSCGPMLISDYVEGQYVTLKKNPDFTWGTPAKVDEVIVRYNEDPMAQVQALQNGDLDIIQPQVTADVLTAVQGIDGVSNESGYEGTYEHVDLTYDNGGPFDPATYGGDADKAKKVRQAFLKTIPRQQIVDTIIKPTQPDAATRDSYNLVPGSPNYDATVAANGFAAYQDVDIEGAKALLAEAGVTAPQVRLMYGKSNARRVQEFQLIHESATQAGFEIIDAGSDEWGTKLGDNTYDASLFGWQNTSTAVFEPAANFISTGQNNFGHFSNTRVDELYSELETATDPKRQEEINTEVETILLEDGFGITLYQFPSVLAWRDDIKNVSMTAISGTMFWNFWDWEVAS